MKKIITIVGVIAVIAGAYYFYNRTGQKTMTTVETTFNDTSAQVLVKDFNYSAASAAEIYQVMLQIKGSLAYKIFINEKLIDSGEPKFGAAGGVPITPSVLKEGANTLRVEINPNPVGASLGKNEGCDVAIIGASKGDIASTMIDDNENILARATCDTFVKDISEEKNSMPTMVIDGAQDEAGYEAFFKKSFPKDFETNWIHKSRAYLGPIMLEVVTNDGATPNVWVYALALPDMGPEQMGVRVVLSSITTATGAKLTLSDDERDIAEQGIFLDSDDEGSKSANPSVNYIVGNRSIDVENSPIGDFGSYTGKVIVSLPLKDGGVFTMEYPFTLKAK